MSVRIARRGSIAASRVTASAATVLTLPGTNNNYASTPDTAANSITGDIDIRIRAAANDWSSFGRLACKDGANGNRSWTWGLYTGSFEFGVSASSFAPTYAYSAAHGTSAGQFGWFRVTWRASDGRVQFFTSTDGASWTQLGTNSTINVGSIYDGTATLAVGATSQGQLPLAGKVSYFELRNGIDGTVVAKYDPSAVTILGTRNPSTLVSSTGETWTMNGSAWDWATA